MSHSVRFLAVAIAAWAGVRAVAFAFDPGHDALAATFDGPAPLAPEPAAPQPSAGLAQSPAAFSNPYYSAYPAAMPFYPPYGWAAPPPPGAVAAMAPPQPVVVRVVQAPALPALPAASWAASTWPALPYSDSAPIRFVPEPLPPLAAAPAASETPPLAPTSAGTRRLSLTGWAHYRDERGGTGSAGLAPAGQLGASQVGARALYRLSPHLDASARYTSAVGTLSGSEAALGLRVRPLARWPLAITLERRERIDGIGRSGFSLFGEAGAYGVALPAGFTADGYVAGGMVGLQSRDWFLDTQLAATRPLWRGIALGGGMWTSAQPGLARADVGPRLSLPAPGGARLHADYRFRVAGNAAPGSGAAVTLAKDF